MRDSVLKAENLTKRVSSPDGSLTIVHDVSLDIAPGESVAIVGASGAGKSTLLALLAGLDLPTSGRVLLEGQDLAQLDEDGRARL
ncbi:ATP-binding cassette domain-containing protein, partial [Acinetobacter baumannii]